MVVVMYCATVHSRERARDIKTPECHGRKQESACVPQHSIFIIIAVCLGVYVRLEAMSKQLWVKVIYLVVSFFPQGSGGVTVGTHAHT